MSTSRDVFDFTRKTTQTSRKRRVEIENWEWIPPGKNVIRAFNFDLKQKTFVSTDAQQVDSLMFASLSQMNWYSADDFFVVRFITETATPGRISMMMKDKIIERILREGIFANGNVFNLLGCSNSQVQKNAFYFMRAHLYQCKNMIENFVVKDDLRSKSVAKRTKYVGLLFTNCQHVVDLPEDVKIVQIDDWKHDQFNFTDGCGIISCKLAHRIHQSCLHDWSEVPSVWQIRFCGRGMICKGVFVVDYSETSEVVIKIRPSMVKLKSNTTGFVENSLSCKLGIVSTSKKGVGSLNQQVVALLSATIPRTDLMSIQEVYLKNVEKSRLDPKAALNVCALRNQVELFEALLKPDEERVRVPGAFTNICRPVKCDKRGKLEIPLAQSQLLMGAALPELLDDILNPGECVVLSGNNFITGEVVVYRSPSYYPGDIRVLRAVEVPDCHPVSYLRNVILFSTKGSRPDPDMMSGGDLDGDSFLVIWDKRITKFASELKKVEPEDYSDDSKREQIVEQEGWIHYVAAWENSILAQINFCFFHLAAKKGIISKECRELGKLFSKAVDQTPSELQKLQDLFAECEGKRNDGPFLMNRKDQPVWEVMLFKQSDLTDNLRPILAKNWQKFYSELINVKIGNDLDAVLTHQDLNYALGKEDLTKMKSKWIMLLENTTLEEAKVAPKSMPKPKTEECAFDCVDKNCPNRHPDVVEWHTKWRAKMKEDLMIFVKTELNNYKKDVMEAMVKVTDFIDEQIELIKDGQQMMAELQVQDSQKSLFEKTVDRFWISEVCKQMDKTRGTTNKAVSDLSCLHIFKETEFEAIQKEFEGALQLPLVPTEAHDTFELWPRFPFEEFLDLRDRILSKYKLISDPELVFASSDWYKDLTCQMHSAQKKIGKCRKELANFRLRESEDVIKWEKLKRELKCLRDHSTLKPLPPSSTARKNTRRCQRDEPEKISTLPPIRTTTVKVQLMLTIAHEISQLEDKMTREIKLELHRQEKKLYQMKEQREQMFQSHLHDEILSRATVRTDNERLKCFNLAIGAALNEVSSRYDLYSQSTNNRSILNVELQMCLKREFNRCSQELSDQKLPIFSKRSEIIELLKTNNAVVIVAETGSGKSTQVPQYLADDLHLALNLEGKRFPRIACTQPRRVAATSIAKRVSLEYSGSIEVKSEVNKRSTVGQDTSSYCNAANASIVAYPLYASSGSEKRALNIRDRVGWYNEEPSSLAIVSAESRASLNFIGNQDEFETAGDLGGWVGYKIGKRGQSEEEQKQCYKFSKGTRIEYITEGSLLQMLKMRKLRNSANYDCVIIDEAHERGKDTDLLMAFLRKQILSKECQVKVVIMSASIDQKMFSQYFNNCPVVNCKGRMFEVEENYRPLLENEIMDDPQTIREKSIAHAVEILFTEIQPQEQGDVLIFLPGKNEITSAVDQIQKRAEQEHNERQPPGYVRKVVCCTNIAETSLTIPGVKFIIDTCLIKKKVYDHQLRVSELKLRFNSQASAKQRLGRAGRIEAGFCYRLCSKNQFNEFEKYDEPILKQFPIDELYLYAIDLFGSISHLELMKDAQPSLKSLKSAEERLLNFEFLYKLPQPQIMWELADLDFLSETKQSQTTTCGKSNLEVVSEHSQIQVRISEEGRLALNLIGDISLEDVRMILAARKLGVVKHAIQMASLLHNSQYLVKKDPSARQKENFEIYTHELGDPFTWMRFYQEFEEKRAKQNSHDDVGNWCEQRGLNQTTLKQIQRSCDNVYLFVKRNKKLGKLNRENKATPDELKEDLLRALIAGYFHNVAQMHDKDFIKAGYSAITPSDAVEINCNQLEAFNYDKEIGAQNDHAHLLKLRLANDSIKKHGDVVDNTFVMYLSLFRIPSGQVIMKHAVRIQPQMVAQYAGKRWLKKCIKMPNGNGTQCEPRTLLFKHGIKNVGPRVLGTICNLLPGSYVKSLHQESNAFVRFMFEMGEITAYGSACEIETLLHQTDLMTDIENARQKLLDTDYEVPYPLYHDSEPLAMFKPGLSLGRDSKAIPEAKTVNGYHSSSKTTVFFRGIPENERRLARALNRIRDALDYSQPDDWGTPKTGNFYYDKKGVCCCKVTFSSERVAESVIESFNNKKREWGMWQSQCCLDNEIEVYVTDTSIYPSIMDLDDRDIRVKWRKKAFTFCSGERFISFDEVLDRVEELKSEGVFDPEFPNISQFFDANGFMLQESVELLLQVREDVYEDFSSSKHFEILFRAAETPWFEVFGDDKGEISEEIENQIERRLSNSFFEYYFDFKLQRHERNRFFEKIGKVRRAFPSVNITPTDSDDNDKELPTVKIESRNSADAINAYRDILRQNNPIGPELRSLDDTFKCHKCFKHVHLKNHRRNNNEDCYQDDQILRIDISSQISELAINLALCGCIYCFPCLFDHCESKIEDNGKFLNEGITCTCGQTILNNDVQNNMSFTQFQQLVTKAWNVYVNEWTREQNENEKGDEIEVKSCPHCDKIVTCSSEFKRGGNLQCPDVSCNGIFCPRCSSKIEREAQFDYHAQGNCLLRRSRPGRSFFAE